MKKTHPGNFSSSSLQSPLRRSSLSPSCRCRHYPHSHLLPVPFFPIHPRNLTYHFLRLQTDRLLKATLTKFLTSRNHRFAAIGGVSLLVPPVSLLINGIPGHKGRGYVLSEVKPDSPLKAHPNIIPGLTLLAINDDHLTNETFAYAESVLRRHEGQPRVLHFGPSTRDSQTSLLRGQGATQKVRAEEDEEDISDDDELISIGGCIDWGRFYQDIDVVQVLPEPLGAQWRPDRDGRAAIITALPGFRGLASPLEKQNISIGSVLIGINDIHTDKLKYLTVLDKLKERETVSENTTLRFMSQETYYRTPDNDPGTKSRCYGLGSMIPKDGNEHEKWGRGGGCINITAADLFFKNASFLANGAAAFPGNSSDGAMDFGGGAGGTISIWTTGIAIFDEHVSLYGNGGSGLYSSNSWNDDIIKRGAGGGGRVVIRTAANMSYPNSDIHVFGGRVAGFGIVAESSCLCGGAGTIVTCFGANSEVTTPADSCELMVANTGICDRAGQRSATPVNLTQEEDVVSLTLTDATIVSTTLQLRPGANSSRISLVNQGVLTSYEYADPLDKAGKEFDNTCHANFNA